MSSPFACPALPKVGSNYRTYHEIDMQKLCDDLVNISFILSPASTAADLYDQYVHGCLLFVSQTCTIDLW